LKDYPFLFGEGGTVAQWHILLKERKEKTHIHTYSSSFQNKKNILSVECAVIIFFFLEKIELPTTFVKKNKTFTTGKERGWDYMKMYSNFM
jgi:hypothetical protein